MMMSLKTKRTTRMSRIQSSLIEDAYTNEGKHVMQCITDCEYELQKIVDLANQDSITEEELEQFKTATKNLLRRATALESWSEDLTTNDWVPEEEDEYDF